MEIVRQAVAIPSAHLPGAGMRSRGARPFHGGKLARHLGIRVGFRFSIISTWAWDRANVRHAHFSPTSGKAGAFSRRPTRHPQWAWLTQVAPGPAISATGRPQRDRWIDGQTIVGIVTDMLRLNRVGDDHPLAQSAGRAEAVIPVDPQTLRTQRPAPAITAQIDAATARHHVFGLQRHASGRQDMQIDPRAAIRIRLGGQIMLPQHTGRLAAPPSA